MVLKKHGKIIISTNS